MTRSERVFKEIEEMYSIELTKREKMLMDMYYTQYRLTILEEKEAQQVAKEQKI